MLFTYLSRWDQTPDRPERVRVHFDKGRPVGVELLDEDRNGLGQGVEVGAGDSVVPVVEFLNQVGGKHGVGLLDMVESRYVGLKSRGVYEAPAHAILLAAHEDLESLVHDHRVLHDKGKRALDVAEAVYQGRWFTQEMESWLAANAVEQERVDGLERGAPVQGRDPARGAVEPALAVQRGAGVLRHGVGASTTRRRRAASSTSRRWSSRRRCARSGRWASSQRPEARGQRCDREPWVVPRCITADEEASPVSRESNYHPGARDCAG